MTKSTRKLRVLLTALLALTLCVSTVGPALAALGDMPALDGNTPIYITKIFQTPEGTVIPPAKFTFSFEKYGIGSEDTAGTIKSTKMPNINDVDITLDPTPVTGDPIATSNFIDTITKEGLIDLSDFVTNLGIMSSGVGQYIYTIRETNVSEASVAHYYDDKGNLTLYTHESEAWYELSLYVNEDSNAELYIQYITVRKLGNDDGSSLGVEEEKVDPGKGGYGLAFTNTYVKANDGKPGDNEQPDPLTYKNILVDKHVVTAAGNEIIPIVVTDYFPFRVTITNADFVADPTKAEPVTLPQTYRAYIRSVDADDGVSGPILTRGTIDAKNGTPDGYEVVDSTPANDKAFYLFTVGTPKVIHLLPGQQLIFTRTPVGTHWVAVEALTGTGTPINTYTASIEVTVNKIMDPVIVGVKGQDTSTLPRLVGEIASVALFGNSADPVLPLGIAVSDLPYYGLIALAIAALAVYIVVKTRKTRKTARTVQN
jgi:hypothetical protein